MVKADYDSVESLTEALKGQDALISNVGGQALGDQNKLIDAAAKAGVKRFIPSEFGSDTTSARTRELVPIFNPKYETVNYLKRKESEISWTSPVTGMFFDWGLNIGFMGFNVKEKKATLFDKGENKASMSSLSFIGQAVVKMLENPELTKNQYVFIAGLTVSQKEILAGLEKVTGSKFDVSYKDADDEMKQGNEKLAKGDHSAIVPILQGVNFSVKENLGDFSKHGLWNEKLGLPKEENLEEAIRAAL